MSPILKLLETYETGQVRRYHAAPSVEPQTLGLHQWGVALIVLHITDHQCSGALLKEALFHDIGEYFTGDLPFTFKRHFPNIKAAVDTVDEEYRLTTTTVPKCSLTPEETAILKLADTLEGLLWCRDHERSSGPIMDRWSNAGAEGIHKFRGVVNPTMLERAEELLIAIQEGVKVE